MNSGMKKFMLVPIAKKLSIAVILSTLITGCGTSEKEQNKWLDNYAASVDAKNPSVELKATFRPCMTEVAAIAMSSAVMGEEKKGETKHLIYTQFRACATEQLTPVLLASAAKDGLELDKAVVEKRIISFILELEAKEAAKDAAEEKEKKRILAERKAAEEKERNDALLAAEAKRVGWRRPNVPDGEKMICAEPIEIQNPVPAICIRVYKGQVFIMAAYFSDAQMQPASIGIKVDEKEMYQVDSFAAGDSTVAMLGTIVEAQSFLDEFDAAEKVIITLDTDSYTFDLTSFQSEMLN